MELLSIGDQYALYKMHKMTPNISSKIIRIWVHIWLKGVWIFASVYIMLSKIMLFSTSMWDCNVAH